MNQILSQRFKEAIKLALAVVIAYGIALSMNWDKPYWAGLAVAMCGLSSLGASFGKGLMRFLGTIIAVIVAFSLISLFSQDRLLFMTSLSLYTAACTYFMGAGKYQSFFNVCGFVCAVICFEGKTDSINVFNTAIMRTLETGTGFLVHTFIGTILWPKKSLEELKSTSQDVLAIFLQSNSILINALDDVQNNSEIVNTLKKQSRLMLSLSKVYDLAKLDSSELWDDRKRWFKLLESVTLINSVYQHILVDIDELPTLKLNTTLPTIRTTLFTISETFTKQMEYLNNNEEIQLLDVEPLTITIEQLAAYSSSEQVLILLFVEKINEIVSYLNSTFCNRDDSIRETQISGYSKLLSFDQDRLLASVRVFLTMWVAFILWIFFRVPGDVLFIMMTVSISMALSTMPHIPPGVLVVPAGVSIFMASIFYLFVMTSLSSFSELGPAIFIFVFIISYLFNKPNQAVLKSVSLTMLISITSITNHQTYSIFGIITIILMFILSLLLISTIFKIPQTTSPEKLFILLSKRFFKQLYNFASLDRFSASAKIHLKKRINNKLLANPAKTLSKLSLLSDYIYFNTSEEENKEKLDNFILCSQEILCRFERTTALVETIDDSLFNEKFKSTLSEFNESFLNDFVGLSKDITFCNFNSIYKYSDIIKTFNLADIMNSGVLKNGIEDTKDSSNEINALISSLRSLAKSIDACKLAMRKISWDILTVPRF